MAIRNYTNKNTDLLELKKAIENYFRQQNYETQSKSSDLDHLVQVSWLAVQVESAGLIL